MKLIKQPHFRRASKINIYNINVIEGSLINSNALSRSSTASSGVVGWRFIGSGSNRKVLWIFISVLIGMIIIIPSVDKAEHSSRPTLGMASVCQYGSRIVNIWAVLFVGFQSVFHEQSFMLLYCLYLDFPYNFNRVSGKSSFLLIISK